MLDGTVVGDVTPGYTNYNEYQTMNFAATAGPHTITFRGLNTSGDSTAMIDNVTLAFAEDGVTQNSAQTQLCDAITDGSFAITAQVPYAYTIAPKARPGNSRAPPA